MVNERTFDLNEVGEQSEESFIGQFKMRLILDPKSMLQKDQIRREYLGNTNGSPPSEEAFSIAIMLSELAVHLTESPAWWKEGEYGAKVEKNVLEAVYAKYHDKLEEWKKEKLAKKEASKETIRKQLEAEKA